MSVAPELCLISSPADLVLRLFHYADLPDRGEGDAAIALNNEEMRGWFSHPLGDPSALAEGLTCLEYFARFCKPNPE